MKAKPDTQARTKFVTQTKRINLSRRRENQSCHTDVKIKSIT